MAQEPALSSLETATGGPRPPEAHAQTLGACPCLQAKQLLGQTDVYWEDYRDCLLWRWQTLGMTPAISSLLSVDYGNSGEETSSAQNSLQEPISKGWSGCGRCKDLLSLILQGVWGGVGVY